MNGPQVFFLSMYGVVGVECAYSIKKKEQKVVGD